MIWNFEWKDMIMDTQIITWQRVTKSKEINKNYKNET